ncbi:MAG: PilZ domain-containing protein [Metallibacterium scheffleri]|jgi:hypothetical protein|uniref:PilZ domain-containing protein n=1 Tax=Metallibacterium scheffleri TaxID=993689 RepID=UPI0026F29DDC|nr:PilZ domain-containing protein [Metallibacterium scheffleri]MCK9366089.1 PilZ domain-containing protein [Metallibacterium scheffleri]
MNDNRRALRKPISGVVLVENSLNGAALGRIGNLSNTGLMLIAPRRLRENALFQISFTLPGSDSRTHALEIGVHEQWTSTAVTPGQFWIGLRIIDISDADQGVLDHWLKQPEYALR